MRRRSRREDDGFALLMVIVSMAVLSLFLLISLESVVNNTGASRASADGRAATAAAQAGVQDYLTRLNLSDTYWSSTPSADATTDVDAGNPALTAAGSSASGTITGGRFTYRLLDTRTQIASTGVLHLRVTGFSSSGAGRRVNRVLTATLKAGASSYAYLSDYEVASPALYSPSDATCGNYWFASSGPRSGASGCLEQRWNKDDVVTGPVHTNDAMLIAGNPSFATTRVETGWAAGSAGKFYRPAVAGNYTANAPVPTLPAYAAPVALPTTTTGLLSYVEPRTDGAAAPGCLYTGATQISFNADGTTMRIRSPGTKSANTPARCYDTSTPAAIASVQTRLIPPVIYVRPTSAACTFPAAATPFSYPVTTPIPEVLRDDYNLQDPGTPFFTPAYDCTKGTAFVQSTASGATTGAATVVAQDDIVITGNLYWPTAGSSTAAATGSPADIGTVRPSLLGLVSGGNTWIYNPIKRIGVLGCVVGSCYASLSATPVVTSVNASIMAVGGSFATGNYDDGSAWTGTNRLTVRGQVSQKYGAPSATGNTAGVVSTGYNVTYTLDPRLTTASPPYFPRPASSPWALTLVTGG